MILYIDDEIRMSACGPLKDQNIDCIIDDFCKEKPIQLRTALPERTRRTRLKIAGYTRNFCTKFHTKLGALTAFAKSRCILMV